jgi:hypothetical protein
MPPLGAYIASPQNPKIITKVIEVDSVNQNFVVSTPLFNRPVMELELATLAGVAGGDYSHIEGNNNVAFGASSHAEGIYTIAVDDGSHVQGKYNIAESNYVHIIGNGTSIDSKSNAHTLDWEGNAWYSGDVYVGSTSGTNKDAGSKKLATEEYVNNIVANLGTSTGIIAFRVAGKYELFFAKNGMTWREWCNSIYNNGDWRCEDDGVADADDYIAIMDEKVLPDDVIIPEYFYDSVLDSE